jgi:hypothetical protein
VRCCMICFSFVEEVRVKFIRKGRHFQQMESGSLLERE